MHAPGAQMLGRWKFEYSLIPHSSTWEMGFREAHNFARSMRAIRTNRGHGELPVEGSMIEIESWETVLSTLKVAADDGSTIVRVYNVSNDAVEGRAMLHLRGQPATPVDLRTLIRLHLPFSKVERVDLNEENAGPIEMDDGAVRVELKANEIVTLRFS
jgi:alpha-mannosidase